MYQHIVFNAFWEESPLPSVLNPRIRNSASTCNEVLYDPCLLVPQVDPSSFPLVTTSFPVLRWSSALRRVIGKSAKDWILCRAPEREELVLLQGLILVKLVAE